MKTDFNAQDLTWIDKLADNDFIVIDHFLTDSELDQLQVIFTNLIEGNDLVKAGIGSFDRQVINEVRGDFIHWIDEKVDRRLDFFFDRTNEMVELLNRYCYLGIKSHEFHFALYPAGSYYEKHLDQFQEQKNRMISVVFYLNQNWQNGDGGELKIYRPEGDLIIDPIANRLVLFKSDIVAHEVLITHVPRKSITGWLLRKPSGLGFLSS